MSEGSRLHVLVTGGAGYIGSHTAVALHAAGFWPVLLDNLDNASVEAVAGVREICQADLPFHQIDVRDGALLDKLFSDLESRGTPLQGILHFAAHKAVGESVEQPARYASNNVGGLAVLLEAASKHGVDDVVFSSSCTVYGEPPSVPVSESAPLQAAESPYGWTKQACERVLTDHATFHRLHHSGAGLHRLHQDFKKVFFTNNQVSKSPPANAFSNVASKFEKNTDAHT